MDKIRVIELFAGYGSQHLALKRLQRDFPDFEYEVVSFCEIEDNAIKAYQALHGDHIPNLGDITQVNPSDVPDCDLMTWSFPCQSISSAGRQHGLAEGSGTRSSLCWDAMRIFEVKRPKYLLMENVAALVSEKFVKDFNMLQLSLQKMGYTNFVQLINAKDMGVPQNRLRVFMVSILDCADAYYFPKPFPLKKRLKDVLEKSVPETCYLSQERVDGLVLGSDSENAIEGEPVISAMRGRSHGDWYGSEHQQRLEIGGSDTSFSLTSVAKDNLVLEPAILSQQRTEEGKEIRRQHKGDVGIPYSHKELVPREDGISNTLSTVEKDNLLVEPIIIEDFYQDRPIRVYEGEAPTLRSDRAGLKVAEPIVTNEKWVDIDGYEGLYQISNFGRVKSLERIVKKADYLCPIHERILVNKKDKDGYCIICLSKENVITTFKVHRLVAQAFIPNPQNLPEVNHIDRNRQNNNVNNLEWCTRSYNSTHSSGRVVVQGTMDGQVVNIFPSTAEASRSVKCTPDYRTDIVACCKGKTKSAFGYKWWYATDKILLGWSRSSDGKEVSYHKVDIANCVTAGKRDNTQNYVLEQVIEEVRKAFPNRGILMYKGNPYFVRKLSTRELYRLMDLEENDIDTLLNSGISKTQHCRLAGNSIVVNVLYHIFRTMFIDTVPLEGTQTTLF